MKFICTYAFGEFTTSGPIAVYKDLTLTEL